jgi:hypothetical protein
MMMSETRTYTRQECVQAEMSNMNGEWYPAVWTKNGGEWEYAGKPGEIEWLDEPDAEVNENLLDDFHAGFAIA